MLRSVRTLWGGTCLWKVLVTTLWLAAASQAEVLSLADLDLSKIQQGWGEPKSNKSADGNPLSIGGQTFKEGVGTHADSMLRIDLTGKARRFTAMVGVDDEIRGQVGSV